MPRAQDWEAKLNEVAERYRREPWAWGKSDCAHFAGDCVLAITGSDALGAFRGNYTSRLGAWARLRYSRHLSVSRAVEAAMSSAGYAEGVPECAMVGDVGVTNLDVLCVRFPCGFIARSEDGLFKKVRPVRSWCIAWPGVE